MNAQDIGPGNLPPALQQRVQAELSPDEHLVWVGQPRPDLYRGQAVLVTIFGGFFTGIALVILLGGLGMTVAFTGFGASAEGGWGGFLGCFPLCFCLFTAPFVLIGGYMLAAPLWMPRRLAKVIYALTDRRALIWEPSWFGDRYTVRTYTREGLGRMARVDRADGAGDLVFEEYYTTSTNNDGYRSTSRHQRGFLGIDQVREVEQLVRQTLHL